MASWVYVDGALVPGDQAAVSPLDRGLLYGYGLFETVRAYEGRCFRLGRHLERLMAGAERLALAAALDRDGLERAVYRTLEANGLRDARVRLTVTAGVGERGLSPPLSGAATVIVVAEGLAAPGRDEGVSAAIVGARRNSASPLAGIKSLNYLEALVAHAQALAQGAQQAIMLNERGHVAEGSTSNIFLVSQGRLLTPAPACGILCGITREAVLECAADLGIEAAEVELPAEALFAADEVFLTSSIVELAPVARVDGRAIGDGGRGKVTAQLAAAYRELVRRER